MKRTKDQRPAFVVAGRSVGSGQPCFLIAEAGVNHNGDPEQALELVRRAKAAGADCVKFQTFRAEDVATAAAPKAAYQLKSTDPRESQIDMLRKLVLPKKAYPALLRACEKEGLVFLSTPYGLEDVDFLDSLGVAAFKIASGQVVEPKLLAHAASKGKPLIVSTGMATLAEVAAAVRSLRSHRTAPFALLQCTTNYPSAVADSNLRAMLTLREEFEAVVGYSDHTMTPSACLAAVALGASIIEKHFTLDKTLPGPDHRCSANPTEFAALTRSIREVEASLGSPVKAPTGAERANAAGMRRSLVAAQAMKAGERITESSLAVKRPGTGLSPSDWDKVVGRKLKVGVAKDTLLSWEHFDG